jgi:PKD repeat protein
VKAKKPAAKAVATSGLRAQSGTGFTLGVPTGWARQTVKDSVATFVYRDPATKTNVVELASSGRGTRTMAQWAADLQVEIRSAMNVTPAVSYVTLPAGKAIRLSFTRTIGTTKVVQVQYAVDAGPTAYDFTFTTTSSRATADLPVFARMMASLHLTS